MPAELIKIKVKASAPGHFFGSLSARFFNWIGAFNA
jgi:hypothetical protein